MVQKSVDSKALFLTLFFCPTANVLCKVNEPIKSSIRISRMFFLFEHNIYPEYFKDDFLTAFPESVPSQYGPQSKIVLSNIIILVAQGAIKAEDTQIPLSKIEKEECEEAVGDLFAYAGGFSNEYPFECKYCLSDKAKEYIGNNIWNILNENQKEAMIQLKSYICSTTIEELIYDVCKEYPQYKLL